MARSGLGLIAVLALMVVAPAHAAAERSVQAIDFTAREGDAVVVTLTLSAPVPEPKVFTLDKPARLSLDLPNTSLAVTDRLKRVNIGKVRSVAVAEAEGRSRVVVFLSEPVAHQVRVVGNKLILELGTPTALAAVPPPSPTAETTAAPPAAARVSALDFRRGETGQARVMVTLSDPATQVDVREEAGNVVATFKNVSVDDKLLKRYDVLDFATPAKFVDVRRTGADVQVTVTPVGDYERVAYQTGGSFTLELAPLTPEKVAQRKRDEPQFTGERISLSFQNIDVRALLQIIADVANVNMVVSDQVQGEMAMRLQNVPWDQALDIILRSKGLGQRREGNVILVAPLQQLAERDKAELEAQKQNRELAPLRSEIIQINYANASDLATLIKSKEASQLSERGSVTVDARTNTLLVLETRDKINEIRELVARLDIPVRQVLIESRIVIARDDFTRELGSRFGVTHLMRSGNSLIGTSGTAEGAADTVGVLAGGDGLPDFPNNLNFSVPAAASGAGHFALAVLSSNWLVELELSALQTEGRGEIISTPHVVTATGKKALVEQGQEVPFSSSSGVGGATTTQFKKATLALEVTPFITPDDRVQMDLTVRSDAIGQDVPQATGGTAKAIDTRHVDTSLLVDNGATVVLGGVYADDSNHTTDKIPLLGDIPFIGTVFKHNVKNDSKRELLIFVTPKILKESLKTP
ncbi:MAG TPA: type IV pilus secretin PilQ [Nevskiaceae bacterium]|nr:type IV pilus secretin PilQ [Nevskiaceae bacterium]